MNYGDACKILDLPSTFTCKELKHNYYLKALRYHPDKNPEVDATNKFQEVLDAYIFLNKYKDIIDDYDEGIDNSYLNIFEKFIGGVLNKNIDIKHFSKILNNKCSEITIEILKHFSHNTLLKLHEFVEKYADILYINREIVERLNELINNNNTSNDIIKEINPTLDNLMNNDIYIINHDDEIYYIPMWHHELVYELSGNSLVVYCEPELPEFMSIDQYNNIYVNLSMTLESILNDTSIEIVIGERQYIISVSELYIKKYQRYTFKQQGISVINIDDVYNVDKRANIYIDIHLSDII